MERNIKKTILLLSVSLFIFGCSNKNDIDNIVSTEYNRCKENTNCLIDFAHLMNFEWDTMCYYSGANSLEEINKDLGFELRDFTDIGDRVIFFHKGKIIYQKEWFYNPSEPPKGIIFMTDLDKFRISKSNAKFEARKEGNAIYLIKI